jgi:hypothetical protein
MNKISFVYGMVVAAAVCCLGGVSAQGQTSYCVRAGANGNGSGSDWNNAFPALPATLQRGATYYVAAGNYGSYRFDDPVSGTALITIKKATATDHKTDTGWAASYGSGQAVFSAPLSFTTDNWVFDGATRNESNWFESASYGFVIGDNNNVQIDERGIGGIDNVTVKYTYLKGINSTPGSGGDIGRRHIWIDRQGNPGSYSNWTVSRCFFQYGNVGIQVRECANFIAEYNAWSDNWSSQPNNHGENVSAYYGGNDGHIYRFNHSRNMIGTAAWAVNTANNWQLYGNVYEDCEYGDGFVGFIGGSSTGFQIYNETVIRPVYFTRQISLGGNSVVKNCVFMMGSSTPSFAGCTVSSCSFSSGGTGTSAQTGLLTSLFANYTGGDYRLLSATAGGESLPAPFNMDRTGKVRGQDGVFDRGAFEYNPNSGNLVANAGLDQLVTLPSSVNLVGSIVNQLGGLLSLSWSKVSGPGTVSFSAPTVATTSASFSTAGTYVLRLTATVLLVSVYDEVTVTVQNPPDTAAPTVTLTAPAAGTVSDTITLSATASDNIGVAGVKFYVGGTEVFDDTTSPYSYSWDSRWVNNGTHQVYAQARDAAGNVTRSVTNTITVANPVASLPNPVAGWAFNEGSGTTATDSFGNNVLALRNGAVPSGSGKFGTGLVLDGVNDRADAPSSASLNANGSAISVAAWVKLENQNGWQQILVKIKESGAFTAPYFAWHLFGGPDGTGTQWTPMFQLANTSEASVNAASSVNVNYGEWVHLVGVYDGTAVRIYVNGVERGSAPQTGNILSYTQPLYVGAHGLPGEFARGVIDEVRVYSQALSASQVQALFTYVPTSGTLAPPSGLHVVLNP